MSTKQLRIEATAALNIYFVVWRSDDNYVFDFNDNTFKATVGAATTPYLATSENTPTGGAGRSHYTASLDLALLGSVDCFVQPYQRAGGSPAPLTDTTLEDPLALAVQVGQVGAEFGGRITCVYKRELDTFDADFILLANGQPISFDGTGELSVRTGNGTLLFTALSSSTTTDAVDSLKHLRFTKLTPGFTGDRDYSLRLVLTDGNFSFTIQDTFTILA